MGIATHTLEATLPRAEATVRVDRVRAAANGVVELVLRDPAGTTLPEWTPGSHLDLHLPDGVVRQYSLCGDPADRSAYRVAVLREPNSRGGSRWIHDGLREGDVLGVSMPRNNFALVDADSYVLVAGGIGITPMLAMTRELARRGADWRLLYGGRTRASMAFLDELDHLDGGRGRVVVHRQDEAGLLPLRSWLSAPRGDTAVYCCGPEPLLDVVEYETLLWPLHALHVERFSARPLAAPERRTSFTIELARSGGEIEVGPETGVLEALAARGVDVLSSCGEGTCGTCVTRVLGGTPDHRDSILTPAAREACDRMYPCVSRSCSDRLVLDI